MDLSCGQTFVLPLKNTTNWTTEKLVHSKKGRLLGEGQERRMDTWRLVELEVFLIFFFTPSCSAFIFFLGAFIR